MICHEGTKNSKRKSVQTLEGICETRLRALWMQPCSHAAFLLPASCPSENVEALNSQCEVWQQQGPSAIGRRKLAVKPASFSSIARGTPPSSNPLNASAPVRRA